MNKIINILIIIFIQSNNSINNFIKKNLLYFNKFLIEKNTKYE
jgi:hypothetical protein